MARFEHGSVWIHNGKIAGVGATVNAPAGAKTIDAAGKFVTPGIIDPHSHSALGDDINEATSPVTPSMMMIDAFDNRDKALVPGVGRRRNDGAAAAWIGEYDRRPGGRHQEQVWLVAG